MSRLTRDGTAEPVSRDQILRHARGQGNVHFPCSADHEQDWQPYPVDPYSAICDDHTYIHTYYNSVTNSTIVIEIEIIIFGSRFPVSRDSPYFLTPYLFWLECCETGSFVEPVCGNLVNDVQRGFEP